MVALKTFTNLSQARREEIINASLLEFAVKGYEMASLSTIIANLGLAKGSFYRYFESKQALYRFLLDHCAQVRLHHDAELLPNPPDDFFDRMLEHFKGKIKFDARYPLHSAFLHTVLEEKSNSDISDMQFMGKSKILESIRPVVKKQVQQKKLRTGIDVDLMSYIALQMNLSILDYIAHKYKIDYRQNIRAQKPLYGIPEKEMVKIARQFMDVFKQGVALKK